MEEFWWALKRMWAYVRGKKYILRTDRKKTTADGTPVYQIQAVKRIVINWTEIEEGQFGGYVCKDGILSHEGTCWIGSGVTVEDPWSAICEDAIVSGITNVQNGCYLEGSTRVNDSIISGVSMKGHCRIDNSMVKGSVDLKGETKIIESCIFVSDHNLDFELPHFTILTRAQIKSPDDMITVATPRGFFGNVTGYRATSAYGDDVIYVSEGADSYDDTPMTVDEMIEDKRDSEEAWKLEALQFIKSYFEKGVDIGNVDARS